MMPARIDIDFARQPRRIPLPGLVLMLAGCAFGSWVFSDFHDRRLQSELLDVQLARYSITGSRATPVDVDSKARERMAAVTQPLATPWSALLNDLEGAIQNSGSDIALLQVAPDRDKREVKISAEARSLPAVFDYMTTLQNATTLRYPVLEQHEVRTAMRERPVRFEISAEWQASDE